MKFRKKPVVIDAIQFDGTLDGALRVFEMFDIHSGKFVPSHDLARGTILIPTLEGNMLARLDDWIIKGVKGEFYPCRDDIFQETYEATHPLDHPHIATIGQADREAILERERQEIIAALEAQCHCHEAFTIRGLRDTSCECHDLADVVRSRSD